MSSPHMSFRLNYYQIAKALRILVTLEPNQPIASLSQAAKLIIIDWISKHSVNAPLATSQADIEAVKAIDAMPANQINPYTTIHTAMAHAAQQSTPQAQQAKLKASWQIQKELAEEKIFNDMKRESLAKQNQQNSQDDEKLDAEIEAQIKLAAQSANRLRKASDFHDPNVTDSSISSVTDFSPPTDWKK